VKSLLTSPDYLQNPVVHFGVNFILKCNHFLLLFEMEHREQNVGDLRLNVDGLVLIDEFLHVFVVVDHVFDLVLEFLCDFQNQVLDVEVKTHLSVFDKDDLIFLQWRHDEVQKVVVTHLKYPEELILLEIFECLSLYVRV